jgi:hypothetical protein
VLTHCWKYIRSKICQLTNKELRNLQKYVGSTEQHTVENRLAEQPIGKPGKRLNADLKEMLM